MSQQDDVHVAMRNLASGEFGSFAAKLAEAWFVADSHNRKEIEQTWTDLISRAGAEVGWTA